MYLKGEINKSIDYWLSIAMPGKIVESLCKRKYLEDKNTTLDGKMFFDTVLCNRLMKWGQSMEGQSIWTINWYQQ